MIHPRGKTLATSDVEILIVEDSSTQAERLRYLIEYQGYRVRVAVNGQLALDAIHQSKPNLVLSDIVMPEMDGFALCRNIKADPDWCDIPVILVTSLTDAKDIVRGLECGADNFIRKPYANDYLLTRISHVLMNQQLRKHQSADAGIALYLGDQKHCINSERQQILDLLISTYEQAVLVNEELQERERQVNELNIRLAQHATDLETINHEMAHQNLELEKASRMKSEFMANMSHELRTPLNAIIGFSEALKEGLLGSLSAQQKGYIGDIFDSGKHLLSLINDILDLSKIEAGKIELQLEPTDIKSLMQDCLTVVKERAFAHALDLRFESQVDGEMLLDQRKTKQIVYNLLSNAVKFTPDNGAVTLRTCRVKKIQLQGAQLITNPSPDLSQQPVEYLQISVTDTGIGISREDLKLLFQPFVQLDSNLSRKYEGTGLGLALIKELVELHGGALAVNSKLSAGSEFMAWLPYREVAAVPASIGD